MNTLVQTEQYNWVIHNQSKKSTNNFCCTDQKMFTLHGPKLLPAAASNVGAECFDFGSIEFVVGLGRSFLFTPTF